MKFIKCFLNAIRLRFERNNFMFLVIRWFYQAFKDFFLIKILKNNSYNYKEKETEENTFEQLSCLT